MKSAAFKAMDTLVQSMLFRGDAKTIPDAFRKIETVGAIHLVNQMVFPGNLRQFVEKNPDSICLEIQKVYGDGWRTQR